MVFNPVPEPDGTISQPIQGVPTIPSLSVSSVNGDPHFMITSPSGYRICFDVNGRTGEVMKLIEDPITGGCMINLYVKLTLNT